MSNFITKEFQPVASAAWKQKIQMDLKGADYNETLLTSTLEGITIKPFYHKDEFRSVPVPKKTGSFDICQSIEISDAEQASQKALSSIEKGADSLIFKASTPFDYEIVFKDLKSQNVTFHFDLDFLDGPWKSGLLNYLKGERIFLNIDILGRLASTGNWFVNKKSDTDIVESLLRHFPDAGILAVRSDYFQNAGAHSVQQVTYCLAQLSEYVALFGEGVIAQVQACFAMGYHYFFEISKLRTFRYLSELIFKTGVPVLTTPSKRNKTLYDYNVNMLRTTTECMSAILGGCDTVANLSYDDLFNDSNEFGERISRNQLIILKDESYFKQAQQMASGSYYIEEITVQMAQKSLKLFKEIEQSGGFYEQLMSGTIERKIREIAQKEQAMFDDGQLILVGTNKYPNDKDFMKQELKKDPFMKKRNVKTLIKPIISKRLSEGLEQNRLSHEA